MDVEVGVYGNGPVLIPFPSTHPVVIIESTVPPSPTRSPIPTPTPIPTVNTSNVHTSYRALTSDEMQQVVEWAVKELQMMHHDVCWKDSYGNGVGETLSCESGYSKEGLLCYETCSDGYEHVPAGLFCRKSCPSGFGDGDLFCYKPSPYGRGSGHGCMHHLHCSCRSDEDRRGLFCYPKCRTNYHAVGCCICSPNCPSGFTDIGVSCKKPSYSRAVKPLTKCRDGLVQSGLLCYPPCRQGFHPIGPVCWGECPVDQPHDCAGLCSKDKTKCALATLDMVLAPLEMVADLVTLGAASAASAAAKALTREFKLSEKTANRLHDGIESGDIINEIGFFIYDEVMDIENVIESSISNDPYILSTLISSYGHDNAYVIIREVSIRITLLMIKQAFIDFDLQIASFMDPTGILSVIQAYKQPKCRTRTTPPIIHNIIITTTGTPHTIQPRTLPTHAPTIHVPTTTPSSGVCWNVSAPVCLYGNATLVDSVSCTYTCPSIPSTCPSGDPIVNCSSLQKGCTYNNPCDTYAGMECQEHPCQQCNVTCTFNPALCVIDWCRDPEVIRVCEPGTCTLDNSYGCNWNCTLRSEPLCIPPTDSVPPVCSYGVSSWDVVNCTWQCPTTCFDGSPLRSCVDANTSTGSTCPTGYNLLIDYCPIDPIHNNTLLPHCVQTCTSQTTQTCIQPPCLSLQAQQTCIPGTCTNNHTDGCNYSCSLQSNRSALSSMISFQIMVNPNLLHNLNVPTDQYSVSFELQLEFRLISRAIGIENITVIQQHDIFCINTSTHVWNITIGFRSNNTQNGIDIDSDTQTEAYIEQFLYYLNETLTNLTNGELLFSIDGSMSSGTPTPISSTPRVTFTMASDTLVIDQALISTQTCPDNTIISAFDACPITSYVAATNTSSSSTSTSNRRGTGIDGPISATTPTATVTTTITTIIIMIISVMVLVMQA